MKKIITICVAILMFASVFAQAPEKMSYQAVVRNASNALVTSRTVGMQISILQGSISGIAVYIERHTPTTNANGLASFEIGGGTVVTGSFSAINWASGPYFIKTETDPTGGTSYSIAGTSQLISVPYALHATTAETVEEIQTISRIGTTVTLSSGGGTFTDSIGVYTAGTGINIIGNVVSATTHFIGENYGGGIVFFVYDGGQHGLIASTADQSSGAPYRNSGIDTKATADGIGAGLKNTAIILGSSTTYTGSDIAATYCNEYSATVGGVVYGDWYLPSKYELYLLHLQKSTVGGFANDDYWSSNNYNIMNAWLINFASGLPRFDNISNTHRVRAIRAF